MIPAGTAPGSEVYQTIVFRTAAPCSYTVTFNETGLAPGTSWDVTLDGTTMTVTVGASPTGAQSGTSITFSGLCVGSYTFVVSSPPGYSASPASGVVVIPAGLAPGSEVYQTITFSESAPCSYTVTFNEAGLPSGTSWDATLNGTTVTATVGTSSSGGPSGTSITFFGLCIGNYTFSISSPAGYSANPASGVIVVPPGLAAGSEVYEWIQFSPTTPPCSYTVTFNETGLPYGPTQGVSWDVTLNGVTMTVSTAPSSGLPGSSTITFSGLCVGSYTFVMSSPPGYSANPASGVIVVPPGLAPGSEVYEWVQFGPTTAPCNYTVTFNESALPYGAAFPEVWDITLTCLPAGLGSR